LAASSGREDTIVGVDVEEDGRHAGAAQKKVSQIQRKGLGPGAGWEVG
jgi:hypothetical protein